MKIHKLRQELYKLVEEKEGFQSREVLEKSRELDDLINLFNKKDFK